MSKTLTTSKFTKVDVKMIKLKAGQSFVGKLTAISEKERVNPSNGEVSKMVYFHFNELSENDLETDLGQVIYIADAGLRNAFSMANIKTNDVVKVVKLEKSEMHGGRTVNNYELYKAN